MAALNIYKENMTGCTVISNYFIDHYMADANEAQLQVYLYLLRMVSSNLPISVADIADKLDHSEKEVLRALKYWELQKLLTLDYDNKKKLTGIHFNTMPMEMVEEALTATAEEPVYEEPASTTTVMEEPLSVTPEAATQPVSEETETPSIYVKPTYTAAQLKAFKEQSNSGQLLYVAEAYVGKTLSVSDLNTIYFMWDVLHFSDDLIDYLIQYCVDRDIKDFRYMEKVAISWAEQGITTPQQAELQASSHNKLVYSVMKALGKDNKPTAKELDYIQRWTKEYGFDLDIILEACDRTVLTTDKRRFVYADGILRKWKDANVHHKADIIKLEELHQKQKTITSKPTGTNNSFNNFTQNTYDFAELEKELLSN